MGRITTRQNAARFRPLARFAALAAVVFTLVTLVGYASPASATVAGTSALRKVSLENVSLGKVPEGIAVTVKNVDPSVSIRVQVDGSVQVPALPPGETASFVVDPGRHTFSSNPVFAPASIVESTLLGADGDNLSLVANESTLKMLSKKATPAARAATKLVRTQKPVTVRSVIVGALAVLAAAAAMISQLSILRTRMLDDRASIRMAEIASRSLSSLPPLSMDKLARSRQHPNLRGAEAVS